MSIVPYVLTVVAVSMLILVHEFGHFVCAKAVGMRVEVFSIGFWKRLVGFRIGETDYRISLIPLGGYVKVTGESPEEGQGKPYQFWSKTPGQRALFVVGGVAMNVLMALVLFIVAFAVGVPFTAANVGAVEQGSPAWRAGIQRGDKVVQVNDVRDPVFEQLIRNVALRNEGSVRLEVERDGRLRTVDIQPKYSDLLGARSIGLVPQFEPTVTGLAKLDSNGGVSPAREGGVELGDRILAVNGARVSTAGDVQRQMLNYPDNEVSLLVERDGDLKLLSVHTVPHQERMLGISAISSTVTDVQPGGPGALAGLRNGDRITAVNGQSVRSVMGLRDALGKAHGAATIDLERDGSPVSVTAEVADAAAARDFVDSLDFESGATLTWVQQGGPAYEAGMRPGDRVLSVAGKPVESWTDVLQAGQDAGEGARQIDWSHDGETRSATMTPALSSGGDGGVIGVVMDWPVMEERQYGAISAIGHGLGDFWQTMKDIVFSLQGIATHKVSSRTLGGIVTIARITYRAAEFGLGKLFYLTAVLAASIAFLNILPVPVLDGGHLLFLAIEKLRGRRVSEKAMAIAQTVGGVLLIMLVVYVTRNDIRNWLFPQ